MSELYMLKGVGERTLLWRAQVLNWCCVVVMYRKVGPGVLVLVGLLLSLCDSFMEQYMECCCGVWKYIFSGILANPEKNKK